jgi:ankyrin repeat protein
MSRQLPPNPNIRHLKNQAKQLRNAHRASNGEALSRIKTHLPQAADRSVAEIAQGNFTLQEAQLVIAREYGFQSWPRLTYQTIGGTYPKQAARMAFPGKFIGRVHLNACRTGFMICPGLGPDHGRPYYDDRWGTDADWIDGEAAWALCKASTAGDLKIIEGLLDDDPRLVNALHWYTQPVHMAARHGHADATALLLERGADPGLNIFGSTWASLLEDTQARDFKETMAVIEAAMAARFNYDPAFKDIADLMESGDIGQVESALRDRPDLIGRSDDGGNNGLHRSILLGRRDLAELFLKRGIPIDKPRADGKTPLTLSFDGGFGQDSPDPALGLRDYLLEKGAAYVTAAACYRGDRHRVEALLSENPDSTGRDDALKSPLAYGARAGHEEIIRLLLDADPDDHAVDEALFEAVWAKHAGVVKQLLDAGANPNVEYDSCGCAVGTDDPAIREMLIQHGAVYPPAWQAGANEVRRLMARKASRTQDPYVISQALGTGDEQLIDTLLAEDPKALNSLEDLQYLPGWGDNSAITKKLITAGLNPNRRTFEGTTYLHECAKAGHTATAEAFLTGGSEVNVLDEKEGRTPLAVAVQNGQTAMVHLLLDRGADPNLADWPWTRPLAIAIEVDHAVLADILRQHGAVETARTSDR